MTNYISRMYCSINLADLSITIKITEPVSYTHLDVYKRQGERMSGRR